jgi:hypothetical protein
LNSLAAARQIDPTTLVREDDDGPWVAAEEIGELIWPESDASSDVNVDLQSVEWHFSGTDDKKEGPVAWSVLKAMVSERRLKPDALVWRPGMASWIVASSVPGLCETSQSDTAKSMAAKRKEKPLARTRAIRVGSALAVLLGLALAATSLKLIPSQSTPTDHAAGRRSRDSAIASVAQGGPAKHISADVERLLDDAIAALRLGQIAKATLLADRYLAEPLADRAEAAKVLRREMELASSVSQADAVARSLNDDQLKTCLRDGAQSLVDSMQTLELRPIYKKTLLRAFRQEHNRRQFTPRDNEAADPNLGPDNQLARREFPGLAPAVAEERQKPADQPKSSVLGKDERRDRGQRANRQPGGGGGLKAHGIGTDAADFENLLDEPEAFIGKTLVLNGLLKVGTKLSEVKGSNGQVLGWALPVARDDDSTVCAGGKAIDGSNVFIVLDDRLSVFLDRVFSALRLRPTIKPSYKCILTVTTRRMVVKGSAVPVVIISALEILGGCDYLSVARHQYSRAFRTLTVTVEEANVDFGDGDLWVDRLGGEENFAQPLRRKFREMQRRAVTNRDSAVIDAMLNRELATIVATANAINQIVAMEGYKRLRVWP